YRLTRLALMAHVRRLALGWQARPNAGTPSQDTTPTTSLNTAPAAPGTAPRPAPPPLTPPPSAMPWRKPTGRRCCRGLCRAPVLPYVLVSGRGRGVWRGRRWRRGG